MNKFWMVYVEGGESPKFKHENFDSAMLEAKRLAKLTDKEVFVLEATRSVKLRTFEIKELKETLPF